MAVSPLSDGALLAKDDYEITGVLGRGGFGITYLARDRQLRSTVAIKEYAPADFADRPAGSFDMISTDVAEFDWGLNRFREEGRTLARFKNTSSIVSVARIFDENRTAYLVMEYIDGPNIVEFSESISNPKQIESLFIDLRAALASMHDVGFVHSDLKPENILVRTQSREPILIDFGSTRQQSVDRTMALVTPHYSPVEQYASDSAHGPYTDIYSLSATFYRVITGDKPSDAPSRVLDDDYSSLQGDESLRGYNPDILAQIDAGMKPLPKERPQSIKEWLSVTATNSERAIILPTQQSAKQETPNPKVALSQPVSSTPLWQRLSQEQRIGAVAGLALAIAAVAFFPSDPRDDSIAGALNEQISRELGRPSDSKQTDSSSIVWDVAVDANAWTPIKLESRLGQLPPGANYDLRFDADEPFRVLTSNGLATASRPGKDYGLVDGEIYLKNVNVLPQSVEAQLILQDQ